MTLNSEMAFILRYFNEFGSFRVHCVIVIDKSLTMDSLIMTMSSSKRLLRDRAAPTV